MDKVKRLREILNRLEELRRLDKENGLSDEQYQEAEDKYAEAQRLEAQIEKDKKMDEYLKTRDKAVNEPPVDNEKEDRLASQLNEPRFDSFGLQLQAIARSKMTGGVIDKRLIPSEMRATGMSEGVPSDGGFFVQSDFQNEITSEIMTSGQLISMTNQRTVSTNANSLTVNAEDETSRANGSRHGGVRAYWAAEGASVTASKPKYRQMVLNLNKLMAVCYVTDEELQDAAFLGQQVQAAFTEELTFKAEDAIVNGTGAGQPLGILNAGCLVSITKETGQVAATIVEDNIYKMYARMFARSTSNAAWLINQDCWPQIFKLSHTGGTGDVPMFIPAGQIGSGPGGSLLGRPIMPIEYCQTLGTKGDIYLADMGRYKTITKGAVQSAWSMHVQFLTDEMCFRIVWRFEGQPDRASALTPFKGTNTQSAFISLNDRS